MDIDSILQSRSTRGVRIDAPGATPAAPGVDTQIIGVDPDSGNQIGFNVNETINTNDNSAVGDFTAIEQPAIEPEPQSAVEVAPSAPVMQPPEVIDPDKMDFIKTYTKEYDDVVAESTNAVELVLASIDKTVKDHSGFIDIPAEAVAFLDNKPEGSKVSKFDDAQEIVRTIMSKASDAKSQAESAAQEASKIYDDIQQFKKDTNQQIAEIRSRDEFGNHIS